MDPAFKELLKPARSAVLVIDVQNDACHADGAYAKRGWNISQRQKAAHNVAEFIEKARRYKPAIIFTKGIHNQWVESPTWVNRRKSPRASAYLEGSWGAEFYAVKPFDGDAIVVKHRYSAFKRTDLDLILRSQRITTLIVTGGGTQACVESTVRDAYEFDYDVVVVSDCCGTPTIEEHDPVLNRMAHLCATVMESKDILDVWSGDLTSYSAAGL